MQTRRLSWTAPPKQNKTKNPQEVYLAQKNPKHSRKFDPLLHERLQFNSRVLLSLQSYTGSTNRESGGRNEKS